jgi:hypothetical protein
LRPGLAESAEEKKLLVDDMHASGSNIKTSG